MGTITLEILSPNHMTSIDGFSIPYCAAGLSPSAQRDDVLSRWQPGDPDSVTPGGRVGPVGDTVPGVDVAVVGAEDLLRREDLSGSGIHGAAMPAVHVRSVGNQT